MIEKIHQDLETVEAFIVMGEDYFVPKSELDPLYSYEHLIAEGNSSYEYTVELDENDPAGLSESDVAMPVVPMFHVNAWGMPFGATWLGSTQVLPGPMATPKVLAELIETYKVTATAGVPTIWLGLLNELDTGNYD